jgi:hypothetical protein
LVPYKENEILEHSKRIGRSPRCLRYWIAEGCDLNNTASVEAFRQAKQLGKTNVQKSRERRGLASNAPTKSHAGRVSDPANPFGNGALPSIGRKGAATAPERLETAEERAHARLEAALACGDPVQIQAAQDFWLKCSETLRWLDLAVELARRSEEAQISLRQAEEAMTAAAERMRIAFTQFLSSEGQALMGIRDFGEWKYYAIERFRGVLNLTVKNAAKTNSALPDWAKERIETAWNIPRD